VFNSDVGARGVYSEAFGRGRRGARKNRCRRLWRP